MLDEKTIKVLKIRAKALDAARCWFNLNDYVEVHGPTIIPAVGDWPCSFEIKYFDKKAYLAQGLQPYAAAFVARLGKIYTIAPTFRAEKLSDQRHLAEYWRIEASQRCTFDSIIQFEEELFSHICRSLSKESEELLGYFNRSPQDLIKVQPPFPRLTYDEVIDMLQQEGFNVSWGQKLDWKLEKHISQQFNQPFFIMKFPINVETLFLKSDFRNPELTLSNDLIAPEGYGEIGSCAQMIDSKDLLIRKMKEEKIEPSDQQWHMALMKYGFVPHSGFAIGIERLIQWICKLTSIKQASAFPRMFDSIYP
jgi:asparaginyl-tRNA synthetase